MFYRTFFCTRKTEWIKLFVRFLQTTNFCPIFKLTAISATGLHYFQKRGKATQ